MMRLVAIALTLFLCSCTARNTDFTLDKVDIVGMESVEIAGEEFPDQVTLRMEINNDGRGFSLRSARLRVGIGARRSVALTLMEKVDVKRGENVVSVPIKLTVAHNSRAIELRRMLQRRELKLIELDAELKLRRGIVSRRMKFSSSELKESLSEGWREKLWNLIEENINEE